MPTRHTPTLANNLMKKLTPNTPADQTAPPSPARLRGLAFALLGRREWSAQQLTQKLLETGADAAHVAELVAELIASDYQSDQRMASMTVRANLRKGRGPARIRQDLKARALDPTLAHDQLAETNWLAVAVALRVQKFGAEPPNDLKEKARQLRFLQYRGFDAEVCRKALQLREWAEDDFI